jgi:uncharacterized protein (DUF1499 family)
MKMNFYALCTVVILIAGGCGNMEKNRTGMEDGAFMPCPSSPNCVSSMEKGEAFIEPVRYSDMEREEVLDILTGELKGRKDCRELNVDGFYVHAVFVTPLLRFRDDVEFYLPADEKVIHWKSASRVGNSDMGTNRKRLEKLGEKISSLLK